MADKSDDMWTKALSWPDCLNEPGLMGMISDADMLHMMEDPGKHSEDISEVQKDSAHVPDAEDALDSEPPSKLQATCKLDSQAAKTKAHREKQRRAQLNNKYTELAALIDPSKTPKTDRNLILDDAVRVITQLRVENNQLRQLNKLLEERVQEQEAPRGQALYQSYLMSQGGLQPPRVDGASTSNLVNVPAPVDAAASRDLGKQGAAASSTMAGQSTSPSTDPSMLAMQMMSVAMQLLQNKGGGTASAAGPTHTGVPAQTPAHPQWPQGAVPGMPAAHAPHLAHSASGQLLPYTDGHLQNSGVHSGGNGGETGGGEGVQPGNASPQEGAREAPPTSGQVPCMGFKPHALQAPQYMQGYGFPAIPGIPGMAPGWPPSSMMDQARDSKLRPPAA